jgi:hypothetical protein
MGKNMSEWGETTIRTPGSWAGTEDMHRVISELFSHASVLDYQRRSAEAGMREGVAEVRAAFRKAMEARGDVPEHLRLLMEGLLSLLDPDSPEWGGYYPSGLVCPLHEQPQGALTSPGRPVFSACRGVPWCRAHEGVRVEK